MGNSYLQKEQDNNLIATLKVIKTNGVVETGLLKKVKKYEFVTDLRIKKKTDIKITKIEGYYTSKSGKLVAIKINEGTMEQSISTSDLNGNQLKLRVEITYKLGVFKTKKAIITCMATL